MRSLCRMATPGAAAGFARRPRKFIQPGDRVRVSIETLGVLENTFS